MSKQKHRIVLIGGTGMVGQGLQSELLDKNIPFVLVGRDVANYEFLKNKIEEGDIVYYLATENRSNRWEDFYGVNVIGVKNIIKICRQVKVTKLIYVSTVMVFDKDGNIHSSMTGNYYTDSKVMGLQEFKNNLQNNFYVVYPGVVLYRDFRYKKEIKTVIDKIKNYFGFFTQGGIMMMMGNKHRKFEYIYIDELVKLLINIDSQKREVMAVTGQMTVEQYIKLASKTTRFWPFRIPISLEMIDKVFLMVKSFLKKSF